VYPLLPNQRDDCGLLPKPLQGAKFEQFQHDIMGSGNQLKSLPTEADGRNMLNG